jgi:hypothetical protein
MKSKLPRWMVSLREKPPHIKRSPSPETVNEDKETIETSRGRVRNKSPFLECQLLVFLAPARYRVVKITRSSSEMVLRTMKHIVIYPGLGTSLEVIALCPVVWYLRWTCVTRGEERAWEVHMVKGEMDLVTPAYRVGGLL